MDAFTVSPLSQCGEKDKHLQLIIHHTRRPNEDFQVRQSIRFKTSEYSPEHHWTLRKVVCVFFLFSLLFCTTREVNTRPLA